MIVRSGNNLILFNSFSQVLDLLSARYVAKDFVKLLPYAGTKSFTHLISHINVLLAGRLLIGALLLTRI